MTQSGAVVSDHEQRGDDEPTDRVCGDGRLWRAASFTVSALGIAVGALYCSALSTQQITGVKIRITNDSPSTISGSHAIRRRYFLHPLPARLMRAR